MPTAHMTTPFALTHTLIVNMHVRKSTLRNMPLQTHPLVTFLLLWNVMTIAETSLNCGKSSSHSFAVHQCEQTYHQCMHDCGNLNISHHLVSPSPSTPQKPMTTAAPITGITQTKTSISATTKTTETTTQQPTVKTTKLMWVTLPTMPHGK